MSSEKEKSIVAFVTPYRHPISFRQRRKYRSQLVAGSILPQHLHVSVRGAVKATEQRVMDECRCVVISLVSSSWDCITHKY